MTKYLLKDADLQHHLDAISGGEFSEALKSGNVELELGRGRGISNLDKKARITRPAPLI